MRGLAALMLFLMLQGSHARAEEKRFTRVYFPNGRHVKAELALSAQERAQGLMFRESISPDQGMLFFLEQEGIHPFWMKNVNFAIDILWLDRNGRIVHMARSVPPCRKDPCPSYTPLLPSLYVLELAAGRADQLGLMLNDRIEFTVPFLLPSRQGRE